MTIKQKARLVRFINRITNNPSIYKRLFDFIEGIK